jgi:hypothetical protein
MALPSAPSARARLSNSAAALAAGVKIPPFNTSRSGCWAAKAAGSENDWANVGIDVIAESRATAAAILNPFIVNLSSFVELHLASGKYRRPRVSLIIWRWLGLDALVAVAHTLV